MFDRCLIPNIIGISGWYEKIINHLLGGTIITCVGLGHLPNMMNSNIFHAAGNDFENIALAAIPSSVIGGIGAVVLVIIMLNGLNTIGDLKTAGNQSYIIGIPISVTMALALLPDKFKEAAPQMLQYLIGSPIAVAAITAIVLNLILNRKNMTSIQTEGA
ncbi:Xanthine permease [Weissella jogaejeotgali]|uniref:Xanthine permease n=1 Tax=Weissella jogaejeotgali TaxID=1631871 RepID=A0A1L6RBR4_9LACO|nr:hypothetical protein [Weissella jogaejeotgali]APS41999.1 Xanthine permease [Weissella jogaejeotgali]